MRLMHIPDALEVGEGKRVAARGRQEPVEAHVIEECALGYRRFPLRVAMREHPARGRTRPGGRVRAASAARPRRAWRKPRRGLQHSPRSGPILRCALRRSRRRGKRGSLRTRRCCPSSMRKRPCVGRTGEKDDDPGREAPGHLHSSLVPEGVGGTTGFCSRLLIWVMTGVPLLGGPARPSGAVMSLPERMLKP